MRIRDSEHDRALDIIDILLTPEEARELRDALEQLLEHPEDPYYHVHVADSEFKHEMEISIYTDSNLNYFSERIRKLILEDR